MATSQIEVDEQTVYYDTQTGDFFKLRDVGDGVALVNPGNNHEYYRMTYYEYEHETDFYAVSDEAIENPKFVMEEFQRTECAMHELPMNEYVDALFAKANTEIVEKDERVWII
jgi:hypothetical protein